MGRTLLSRRAALTTLLASAVAVLALDQFTKALVRAYMHPAQSIRLIGDLVQLTYVRNTGAAFGLMPGHRATFVAVSLIVLAGVAVFWWRARPTEGFVVTGLALVVGGALGNLIDRLTDPLGRVTDFLELPAWPVFNVADSAIVVGALMLIGWLLLAPSDRAVGWREPG